jgi:N-acetylglucosamine-6-phosphate deacetylase
MSARVAEKQKLCSTKKGIAPNDLRRAGRKNMRIRARHYATQQSVDILCHCGTILSIGPPDEQPPDLAAGWVAPAFFDLQINGAAGQGFSSATLTVEAIHQIVAQCRCHGIGGLCPTVVTNSFSILQHAFRTLAQACDTDAKLGYCLPTFHLEGPYISPEDGPRGAHPRAHVRPPDWEEFCRLQEAAGGRIRLVTLAPEWPGATAFIERLINTGVVVALGHTAATGVQIGEAIAAGARLSTHLGNGSHALLPRHDNYIWEQLAADELWASLICDGFHLPPAVIKCLIRVKGPSRTILTCDASSLAGLPPGRYREWEQDFEVLPTGKVVVSGTSYLAGSGVFTDVCVGQVIRCAGVSLAEAVDMAGARPRQLLGLPERTLAPGQPADLILFDWEEGGPLRIQQTILASACG